MNPRHPIGVVVERTGLSEHVLRAWERRYAIVNPVRGEGGHRLYSDADVHRLTLVNRVTRAGRPVASVAKLTTQALEAMALEDAARGQAARTPATAHREAALAAVRELAPDRLEPILRRALLSLGVVPFVSDVLGPLLTDVGTDWHTDRISIAHEHAASVVVAQLLGRLARDLDVPGDQPVLAMATPRGERHALGAMMAGVVAQHDGWRVVSIGADLPAPQIAAAAARTGARIVALSIACQATPEVERELADLRQALPGDVMIVVGGTGGASLKDRDGLVLTGDLAHWRSVLRVQAPAGGTRP
jgi:DNA-binding transcriptional MerR regulator/methylmalonyl-CoA mutase cobalamin-binding subunit